MYKTGIPACDQLISVEFHGNIIPQIWYSVFVKHDLKYPKPFLLAIIILADIVYWYRPTEIRDEKTGQILGYKKKFSRDLLQRSYNQIAGQFGCSTGQAKEAIVFLEQIGVVLRVFRELTISGVRCNNILFLNLNVERLRELTYPCSEILPEGVCVDSDGGVSDLAQRFDGIPTEPLGEFHQTNTESNITNISTMISPSIYLTADIEVAPDDGLSEDEQREEVDLELLQADGIPYTYKDNERKMRIAIRLKTDWYDLTPQHFETTFEYNTYVLAVDCLIDMACADDTRSYRGSSVSYARVIDRINEIIKRDDSLYPVIEEAIGDFVSKAKDDDIKDKHKYMMSVIWNSFSTYKVKQDSYFARTYGR